MHSYTRAVPIPEPVTDRRGNLTDMSKRRVHHVATAQPRAAEATAVRPSADLSADFWAALREQIGPERHAVWFGDIPRSRVETHAAGTVSVTLEVGDARTHDWLRKMFRADIEAAVRRILGADRSVEIVWQAAAVSPAADTAGSEASQPSVPRRPPPARPRSRPSPAEAATAPEVRPAVRQAPRLESFVVGPGNRMAHAAVELAGARPGEMSPLILHGPSGTGKTHLLEGICARFRTLHPRASAVYLSAEQFTTTFLQSLHGTGLPGFRRTCRTADLLAIDDLQFFVGKRATIVELQQTIDVLLRQGRQLVFACDREPETLVDLGPDLLVRLRGGMTARLLPPDEDVRRGIVESIAAGRGIAIPSDVVHYVAARMTRHSRELAGAVNRLEATSHMLGIPITLAMAEEALADLVRASARSVRLADIERAVCSAFGIESGTLKTAQRGRKVNHPRMLAMFLARKHTPAPLTEIGSYFGRRSHSTVISAQKAVDEWIAKQSQIVLADATWDVAEAIRRVEETLRAG